MGGERIAFDATGRALRIGAVAGWVAAAAAAARPRMLGDAAAGERETGIAQGAGEGRQAVLDRLAGRGEIGAEGDVRLAALERDRDRHRPGLGRVEMELGVL